MLRSLIAALLLAAVAAAQLASGDSESPDVYRRSVGSGQEVEGSGEEALRTFECACVLAEVVEIFEEGADQQPEDAYRRRRSADSTGGSGSGLPQEPLAFVHQPTARSDGPNAAAVIVRRIVACKCEEAGEGSGDDEAANPSAAPAPTAGDESEVYRRSVASGEEEDAAPVRRSALDTAEASGDEQPTVGLPTISTASPPTLSTRARRSAEGSAEEEAEEAGEDAAEITIATASTAEPPTIPTVEISTLSTAELPTLSTSPLTTRTVPTLASVSTPSTRPFTTASLPTLAPITRARRSADGWTAEEGSGLVVVLRQEAAASTAAPNATSPATETPTSSTPPPTFAASSTATFATTLQVAMAPSPASTVAISISAPANAGPLGMGLLKPPRSAEASGDEDADQPPASLPTPVAQQSRARRHAEGSGTTEEQL